MKKNVLKILRFLLLILFLGNTTMLFGQQMAIKKSALGICRSTTIHAKTALIQQSIGQQAIVGKSTSHKTDLIQGYLFPDLSFGKPKQNVVNSVFVSPTSKEAIYLIKILELYEVNEYSVFALSGQHLYKMNTGNENTFEVDLQILAPGMYFLLIQTNQGYLRTKIIRP